MRASLRTGLPLLLALSALALLAPAPPPAAEEKTVSAGGRLRIYRLYVPRILPRGGPAPLVLVFHGGDRDGAWTESLTGFDGLADREGFLVAYPDGFDKHWNDGRELRDFATFREGVDDIGFVAAMINAISTEHPVDAKRVFAAGFSNGGFFAHYLAARLSGRIVAIAAVSGGVAEPFRSDFKPEEAVSVAILQGTADPIVPYHGGDPASKHGRGLDTDEAVRLWVAADGCAPHATTEERPDSDPRDGCRVDRSRWTGGRNGTEVVLYTVRGGGHTWPGGPQYAPQAVVGRVCRDFDATQKIWEFFRKHSRP